MRNTAQANRRFLPYIGATLVVLFFVGGIAASIMWYYSQPSSSNQDKSENTTATPQNALSEEDQQLLELDFMKKLLVHNQQAIELLDIELARGQSPMLREAAADLKQTRESELTEIKSLLDSSGEAYQNLQDFPQQTGHDMYPTHEGMVTPEELTKLRTVPAASVDRMFLDFMITHVDGSLQLTTDNKDSATSDKSKALVKSITETRKSEGAMLDRHQSQHSTTNSTH